MEAVLVLIGIIAFLGLIGLGSAIRVVQQYEKGIVFRFGQVQMDGVRSAGLTAMVPIADRMQKVNMQTVAMNVPAQEGITEDNVSVRVDAVVYFRVIDPVKAIVNVQNYGYAVSQVAQTSLRSVIGKADMQQLLSDRETINAELRRIMDEITQDPWGVHVERVEIKDVSLPEGMKRSMARTAEAQRERQARIITADGEFKASAQLAAAAEVISRDPAALQLRLLQTIVEVAAEKNSTLVMPLPVEMLRFFDRMGGGGAEPKAAETGRQDAPDLGERMAKAEEELAKAGLSPSAIESPDAIPPITGGAKDAAKATPKDTAKATPKATSKDTGKDAAKDTAKATAKKSEKDDLAAVETTRAAEDDGRK